MKEFVCAAVQNANKKEAKEARRQVARGGAPSAVGAGGPSEAAVGRPAVHGVPPARLSNQFAGFEQHTTGEGGGNVWE